MSIGTNMDPTSSKEYSTNKISKISSIYALQNYNTHPREFPKKKLQKNIHKDTGKLIDLLA